MPGVSRTQRIAKAAALKYSAIPATGNVFFVSSTSATKSDSAGSGYAPESPFATLDYAIGRCTANQGDIIYVMPGHVDTTAAAGGIAIDVAGVSIVGLGNGTNRPKITATTAASATVTVTAANCSITNFQFATSIDELVTFFSVTAAGFTMDNCVWVNASAAQPISFLTTDAGGDDITITNCTFCQTTAPATAGAWITLVGADRARIEDCFFTLTQVDSATANAIAGLTTASIGVVIRNNTIYQLGGTSNIPLTLFAGSTGVVTGNVAYSQKTSQAGSFALANAVGNNYATNVVNKGGAVDPALDT
jgi:hypothetical protein